MKAGIFKKCFTEGMNPGKGLEKTSKVRTGKNVSL